MAYATDFDATQAMTLDAAERLRLELTERKTLGMALCASLAMMALGLLTRHPWLVWPTAGAVACFALAGLCVRRGMLGTAAVIIGMSATGLVTVSCVAGQGLRDPAVLAYPVIIIFLGMTLRGRAFALTVGAVSAAVLFVTANPYLRWVRAPSADRYSSLIDLAVTAVIMGAAVYAVWLVSEVAHNALARAHTELEGRRSAERELRELSTHDALTGAFNRLFFDAEMQRLGRSRITPVSVIVGDVDGLKQVNDRLGHSAGDELLIAAARLLSSVVRAEDVLARIGGDEFAILLPGAGELVAEQTLARIRAEIVHSQAHAHPAVSISLGAATSDCADMAAALRLADERMYTDKLARHVWSGSRLRPTHGELVGPPLPDPRTSTAT